MGSAWLVALQPFFRVKAKAKQRQMRFVGDRLIFEVR